MTFDMKDGHIMNATGDGKAPIHWAARRFISWSHEILKLGKQF